ncbi:MAG: hypothetical protein ABI806_03605 [Candidatus Solibacter sp.]
MKLMLILLAATVTVFAAAEDTKSGGDKANKAKAAEAWLDKAAKPASADNNPGWTDVLAVLNKRHGSGKLPCKAFDTTRGKYFEDFVAAGAIKQGFSIETTRQEFMKATELPTSMTIAGRKRQGCVAE